jgi:transcription elongation factor GreA
VPIDTQQVWLTEETYDRARIELASLLMERATGSQREHIDREQRAARIRQLQELIRSATVGTEPPDDGVAEPGMVLTVRYEAEDLTETFLMADLEETAYDSLPIYSAHSPLGTALCGAVAGEQREYLLPDGVTMTVTLLDAIPYRHHQRIPHDQHAR